MQTTRISSRPKKRAAPPVPVVRPTVPIIENPTKLPSMNRSPWAKLISSMMP